MTKEIKRTETELAPWTDLDQTFDLLHSRMWDAFGFPLAPAWAGASERFRAARLDVTDTGPSYRIVAEIPGIPKENLDIRIRGSRVEIRGEQTKETEQKQKTYVHRERSYAGYYRTLELPEPVVGKDAKASLTNGLLDLELPKEHPEPSSAEVKVHVA
jgi:HSP20 family protein